MNWQDREWVQNQMNRLYLYLVKMGANREDAKDIVQDTFTKAFLYADSIPSDKWASWLFKVAIHAYYDLCRKKRRQVPWVAEPNLISHDGLPEEALLSKESQQEIEAVFHQLSPTYKEQFMQDVLSVASSKNIYYSEPAQKAYQAVKENQKTGLIIGIVVTGTRDQLKLLQGLPFIRAATLGATVDKY